MERAVPEPIDVLVADDHGVFRAGVRLLLDSERDIRVVAEAETGDEAVELARELEPRVAIVDARLSRNGNEAIRRLLAVSPVTRVLVLVMNAVEECREYALDSGASGCLSKLRADLELIDAVRTVARGGMYFTAAAPPLPGRNGGNGGPEELSPQFVLSDRERQVVALTAAGYSSREIGERLRISSKTVDTYRARSMDKLGYSHRWELVRYALRTGLLTTP